MVLLSTAIILTLVYSIWQSMLIAGYYKLDQIIDRKQSPETKTIKLLILLSLQLIVSLFTFIYFLFSFSFVNTSLNIYFLHSEWIAINNTIGQASPYLAIVYFIMLLTKSTATWMGWKNLKRKMMTGLSKPDIDIKLFAIRKSHELGIRKKISIWYTDTIKSPITFGHFKPVILLPVALMNHLSIQETEALIVHELTHIKNNDSLFNHLVVFCEHVFFFNPFIIGICKQIRWERELRCDLQVLHYEYDEITYAESLFKAASPVSPKKSDLFLAAVTNRFSLLKRIEFFTTHQNINIHQSGFQKLRFAFSTFTLALLLCVSFLFKSNEKQNSNTNIAAVAERKTIPFNVSNKTIISDESISEQDVSVAKPLRTGKRFKIEHKKLPASHENLQNDINIGLMQPNEAVSFTGNKTGIYEGEKQIIVKEENPSTGDIITKSYQLIRHNGVWESNLLWVITEKNSNPSETTNKPSSHDVQ